MAAFGFTKKHILFYKYILKLELIMIKLLKKTKSKHFTIPEMMINRTLAVLLLRKEQS